MRVLLLALTLACASACGAGTEAPGVSSSSAGPIPLPSFQDVDPDVVAAVEDARAKVVAAPSSAEAWGALADRFAAHHFLEEAIACYERAEELSPDSHLFAYRLGWMRFMNNDPDAAAPMERALRQLDSFGPAHEAYGQILLREGRTEEAEREFRRASELDARSPHSEAGLGVIALGRGELEQAREHLEEALRRDAQHGEAHIALSRVYMQLGRTDDARRHAELSRSLPQFSDRRDPLVSPSLPPAGSTARTQAARELEKRGDLEGAEEHYRVALKSNPHNELARKRLAMLLVKSDRRALAIELLEEAVAEGTDSDLTNDYLQRIRRERGKGNRKKQRGGD